ncbi:hypothetical protein ACVQ8P_08435 [Dellaglioa sp. BT-FLS60]
MMNSLFTDGAWSDGEHYLITLSAISNWTLLISGLGLSGILIRLMNTAKYTRKIQKYVTIFYVIRIIGAMLDEIMWAYGDGFLYITYQIIIVLVIRFICMMFILGVILRSSGLKPLITP